MTSMLYATFTSLESLSFVRNSTILTIMARILHLGWSFSPHLTRWLDAQKALGHELHLISYGGEPYADIPTHIIPRGKLGKLGYLTAISKVRKIADEFKPDLVSNFQFI